MSVLDRDALESSPLADLHVLAGELGLDGYRRLRKADLVDALLAKQGIDSPRAPAPPAAGGDDDRDAGADDSDGGGDRDAGDAPRGEREGRSRRGRRGGRGREARADGEGRDGERERGERDGRGARAGAGAGRDRDRDRDADDRDEGERKVVEGTIELLPNGSGFVRLGGAESDDVYVSGAQVKRCELVSGDTVSGPVRSPRRSERFASLVRIDAINGRPAEEVAEGTRFDDLPAAFPSERFALGTEDPTVKAIEWLTPFGRGSRVVIAGPARAGKTEALRRVTRALAGHEGIELSVVLAGIRPEEVAEWSAEGLPGVAATAALGASADSQGHAVEQVVEQARRVAARGGHAVVVIDSLELVAAHVARRALAAARNIPDGGSLTVIAAAPAPLGGETTVITLDATLTALGRFPALDLGASGTLRAELLVGDAGAEAIAKARADALSQR